MFDVREDVRQRRVGRRGVPLRELQRVVRPEIPDRHGHGECPGREVRERAQCGLGGLAFRPQPEPSDRRRRGSRDWFVPQEMLQVGRGLVHARVTVRRVERRAAVDDGGELAFGAFERGQGAGTDSCGELVRVLLREHRRVGDEFVQRHAERILVARVGIDTLREAFRGHVAQRADPPSGGVGRARRVLQHERQPEVADMDVALRVEQQVRGLHVPVQHVAAVGVRERTGGLKPQAGDLAGIVDSAAVEPLAVDELHGVITPLGADARVQDLHDVRVVEHRDHARLVLELVALGGVGGQARREEFHRHFPVQRDLRGLEDFAHAAGSDATDQTVIRPGHVREFVPGDGLFPRGGGLGGAVLHPHHQRQEIAEPVGVFGVLPGEFLDPGSGPVPERVEVGLDQVFECRVVVHG